MKYDIGTKLKVVYSPEIVIDNVCVGRIVTIVGAIDKSKYRYKYDDNPYYPGREVQTRDAWEIDKYWEPLTVFDAL